MSGVKKAEIMGRHRFGIQTTKAESFGIAVAEMVKAGAIVFAPSDGGTAETLQHSALLFADAREAVAKIEAVLETPSLQTALRLHLAKQAQLFSAEKFMWHARAHIAHSLTPSRRNHAETASEILCTESH